MVIAISARQWESLVAACGVAAAVAGIEASRGLDLRREADRYEARDAIADAIRPWIADRGLAEVAAAFDAAGVCWGIYKTARELVAADKRVSAANPIFETIDTAGVGRHLAAGPAPRFTGVDRGQVLPAPLLGEHTDVVLTELLGLSGAAIGLLHDKGIVAGPHAGHTS